MAKGTVIRIARSGEFGFIQPDGGGEDVYFRVNWVRDAPPSGVTVELRLEYETKTTPRGLQTQWVRAVSGRSPSRAVLEKGGYRFLNPYNFVRPLNVLHPDREPLLGNCPPQPHDRYVGLTGKLTCKVTVQTPVFISDAHALEIETVRERGRSKEHPVYRFFQYEEQPALPASSLRGMVRSVFEAATNSCFPVFTGHRRLSYHLPPSEALKLVPARVVCVKGKWSLDILNGTSSVVVGQKPNGPQYAAWVMQYSPMRPSRTRTRSPRAPYSNRKPVSLAGWGHRDKCQALIEEVQHPIRNFRFWNVLRVAHPSAAPLKARGPHQRVVTGYLCITNQNIENKHDERLFFCGTGSPVRIPLPLLVRERYKQLIQDYQERHIAAVTKRRSQHDKDPSVPLPDQPDGRDPGFSRFILDSQEIDLKPGTLVYAMLESKGRIGRLAFIVPVSVPRVGYDQRVGERLDPGVLPQESTLHKCRRYDDLCPACRVFGWVYGTGDPAEPELPTGERIAYAGRVRLTHGRKLQITGSFDETLAILSSPKPTTTRFYLQPRDSSPRDGLDDRQVDYSQRADQRLRGRKMYRHQGKRLSRQEFSSPNQRRTDQNRSVKGIVEPQSTFEFELQFENLAKVELGALLWSLELNGWHHRLGLGKPLGFGSVTIEVTEMQHLDPTMRYEEFEAGWEDQLEQKEEYIRAFQKAMAERYGGDFYELDNIRDLKALLAKLPELPVHYPRSTSRPQPEGKNFEWFMGNKRKPTLRLALRLATDDSEGLPLIDKRGEVV